MQLFNKFFLASLGLVLTSQAAQAQLGIGTGVTAPRTTLDVNGAIATYETTATLAGASPSYSIAAGVGQLLLSPSSSNAPTTAITLTCATTPVTGQRLVVVNSTAIPATLSSLTIPAGQAVEFMYSASAWRASSDGGNATTFTNGLTKSTTTNSMKLGGALTGATDIALSGNNLTFSGTGAVGIGVAAPDQALDVNGTAKLRNIPSSGGTVMLTADNNGVIRQQALPTASAPAILGTLTRDGVNLSSSNWGAFNYTGGYITIPANSKYIVQGYMLLAGTVATSTQGLWVRSSFNESPTITGSFVTSPDVKGSPYISGLFAANSPYSMMMGAVIIQNSSGAPKTYYYWAGAVENTGSYTGTITGVGGTKWLENQLFALPIN